MSARTAALRNASAAVVAAAIAGTVLMPLSASADEGNHQALKTTMSAPAPSGPLTRGGATETFELTVTNTTDKVSSYHPWMLLDQTGGSPLQRTDVVYKVEAVSAPATEYMVGSQDGGWQGMFYPAGGKLSEGFEIPAGGKMVWKLTIGLDKNYPTVDGDFTLRAASRSNEIAKDGQSSLSFKTSPQTKPGELKNWFDGVTACQGTDDSACQEMNLHYQVTGDGEFTSALATYFDVTNLDGSQAGANIQTRVKVDGTWKDVTGGNGGSQLPVIPKGFGAASGERVVRLQVKLGPKAPTNKAFAVVLTTNIGLAEGNDYLFGSAVQKIIFVPKATPTSPAPTTPAPTSPAPASPTTAPTSAAPTTAAPTTANAPAATGSLAHTGADSNTGLYTGLAAALIALGGAAAWLGARRRKAVRG
ncbi:LPXTG cell wall anchor domain-containing protein [Streptomyces sp. NPDC059443]|uniref:LPXTG cell wall anchor domain-containing protein n=1 Tax=unclassified Streptomyces TaxID=2593676 RepID=UPI0036A00ABD